MHGKLPSEDCTTPVMHRKLPSCTENSRHAWKTPFSGLHFFSHARKTPFSRLYFYSHARKTPFSGLHFYSHAWKTPCHLPGRISWDFSVPFEFASNPLVLWKGICHLHLKQCSAPSSVNEKLSCWGTFSPITVRVCYHTL
jgi:hypothetical protein